MAILDLKVLLVHPVMMEQVSVMAHKVHPDPKALPVHPVMMAHPDLKAHKVHPVLMGQSAHQGLLAMMQRLPEVDLAGVLERW
ncbi:MAG: hypothetical protein ACFB0C_00410 [Leptolyngbyaceae cyanobacterium]